MKRVAESIRRRYNEMKRHYDETAKQMNQILHPDIINFIFFLRSQQKMGFMNWVVLNQATIEELGIEKGGLRNISRLPENRALLHEMIAVDFKAGFIKVSEADEQALDSHKRTFKEQKRRYQLATFALQVLSSDISNWKPVFSALQYMKERYRQAIQQQKSIDDGLEYLMLDLTRVYILECLTKTMRLVISSDGDQAMRTHMGAVIACYQFLPKDDNITKQAIEYTKRIVKTCNKIPGMQNFKAAFEQQIPKMQRPDKLHPTEFVQAEIPAELVPAFEEIRVKNEELADAELWNTESLCYQYYNIVQQYKALKQVSIGQSVKKILFLSAI